MYSILYYIESMFSFFFSIKVAFFWHLFCHFWHFFMPFFKNPSGNPGFAKILNGF